MTLPFNTPIQIVDVEPGNPMEGSYDRITFGGLPTGRVEVRLRGCRLTVGMWTALLPDPDPSAAVFLSPAWDVESVRKRLGAVP